MGHPRGGSTGAPVARYNRSVRPGRKERKILRLNDEIAALEYAAELAQEELIMHQHLDDDAQRDAAVSSNPIDVADAKETAGDVARAQSVIDKLQRDRARMVAKRDALLSRLD